MSHSLRRPKLLFLYSELADYFLSCIRQLIAERDVEVHVIHWPVNPEAPFKFSFPEGLAFYDRKHFNATSLKEKVESINPDFIYCSGWMDKDYLRAVEGKKKDIPVVIGLDTKWEGKPRQQLARIVSRVTLKRLFSHCWVPGKKQEEYARKLGFAQDKILTGYYVANVDHFSAIGKIAVEKKKRYFRINLFMWEGIMSLRA